MDQSVGRDKDTLRKLTLNQRRSLTKDKTHLLSQKIQETLLKSSLWKRAKIIGLYSSVKNEVQTNLLFTKALDEGKTVFFPRVDEDIYFYRVHSHKDFERGTFGILEPKKCCEPIDNLNSLELLTVPGIVFDRSGYRIGYGCGFYDRVLDRYCIQTIGLAYEFQVVDTIPIDKWDRKLHFIITEKGEYKTDEFNK